MRTVMPSVARMNRPGTGTRIAVGHGAVRPDERAAEGPAHAAEDEERVEERRRDDRRFDEVRHEPAGDGANDTPPRRAEVPVVGADDVVDRLCGRRSGGGGTDDELLSLGSGGRQA